MGRCSPCCRNWAWSTSCMAGKGAQSGRGLLVGKCLRLGQGRVGVRLLQSARCLIIMGKPSWAPEPVDTNTNPRSAVVPGWVDAARVALAWRHRSGVSDRSNRKRRSTWAPQSASTGRYKKLGETPKTPEVQLPSRRGRFQTPWPEVCWWELEPKSWRGALWKR